MNKITACSRKLFSYWIVKNTKKHFFTLNHQHSIKQSQRKIPFSLKHYVEWQIGYDVPIKDKEKFELTTLKDEKYHF